MVYSNFFDSAGLLEQNIDGKSGSCQLPLKISNADAKSTDGSTKVAKSIKSLSFADDVKYLDGNFDHYFSFQILILNLL